LSEQRRIDSLPSIGSVALRSTLPESMPACDLLSEDEILDYAGARLSSVELTRISRHVRDCRSCQLLVQEALCVEHADGMPSVESWSGGANFSAGTLLAGRYLIRRFVGKGAMGEVYEALDNQLKQRRVALKTVVASSSDSGRAESRLRDEVLLAQLVSHPNVCRIHNLEVHEEEGEPPVLFLAMEFIEGESLGRQLRARGAFAPEEALRIARQLLQGLQAAHTAQILHRDLKSDNVMLRTGNAPAQAVITDFGLARAFDPSNLGGSDSRHLVGTIPYMSPEQLHGGKLGPASDIFAFGVVFYEMLTGRLPFKGGLRSRPLAPSSVQRGVSPSLDAFVLACLSLDAEQRYASAELALLALERVSLRPGSRRRATGAMVVAIIVAGMLAAVYWRGPRLDLRRQALLAAPAVPAGHGAPPSAPPAAPQPEPPSAPPSPSPSATPEPQRSPREHKPPRTRLRPATTPASPSAPPPRPDVAAESPPGGAARPSSGAAKSPPGEQLLDPFAP
jgi:serine/threonine protein kinase